MSILPQRLLAVVLPPNGPVRGTHGSLRPLGGKKLVAWTFEQALACRKLFSRLVVATAEHEVGQLAHSYSIEVPFRLPPELAGDGVPLAAVLRHTLEKIEPRSGASFDWICVLDAHFPLRSPQDIERAIHLAFAGDGDAVLGAVAAQESHPLFLKKVQERKLLPYVAEEKEGTDKAEVRPFAYLQSEAIRLLKRELLSQSPTLQGSVTKALLLTEISAIDVHSELELTLADRLLSRPKGEILPLSRPLTPGPDRL